MIDKDLKLPFYAKTTIFFLGFISFITILYIAQGIIVPIVFALIIAILLNPVVNFFVKRKVNRLLVISITLLLSVIVIASFGVLMFSQVSQFSESWPLLVEKFTLILNQSISSTAAYLDVNPEHIHTWITKTQDEILNISSSAIGQTLVTVGSGLAAVLLVPVYIFLILLYQPLLLEFIRRLFKDQHQGDVTEIVTQTKTVIQRYLFGLVIETAIVATLDATALLILGIQYAILLGIIGALLNLIPYIGGLVAVALPMMIALATKSSAWYAVYVLIFYYIIQLIDNNYIVPMIVASKVKINALFSIIVVLLGNMLWGISGMFLSIPLLAIVKLICDHIESLKPWGFLLGDTMPPLLNIKTISRKKKNSIK